MFIIAGLQPRKVTLEDKAGRCSRCGTYSAQLRRVDHYLSLFFIPLVRVKKGEPFLFCQTCGMPAASLRQNTGNTGPDSTSRAGPSVCSQCGGAMQQTFKYCPHCGQRQY